MAESNSKAPKSFMGGYIKSPLSQEISIKTYVSAFNLFSKPLIEYNELQSNNLDILKMNFIMKWYNVIEQY